MTNILIIHYNTPELTKALVGSINKFCGDTNIYIFDNSDKHPFINNFSNVTVFDNTKSQHINFNQELRKYPNRYKSLGRASRFGSFKHCISVQKCFDLIDDDFILLDSDVLLKSNITCIVDKSVLFVGEIKNWSWNLKNEKFPTHKRVLPFICYINVPMCKKMGYCYFDDKHMAGLYNTTIESDSWDTGCWFYEQCKDGPHKEIVCEDYIKHFGGASYMNNGKNGKDKNEWLFENKELFTKNKKLIVTSIINNYEKPVDNFGINQEYDYILVSDTEIKTKCWKNILIEFKNSGNLSSTKKQRYVKTHLCELFPDYELITYIDANTSIDNKLYNYIENNKGNNITFKKHTARNCIYDEIKACITARKISKTEGDFLRKKYISEGYPTNNGLFENNILVFNPKNNSVKSLFNLWWREIFYNSHRDQLSLNYVIWKYNLESIISVVKTNDFRPKIHRKA